MNRSGKTGCWNPASALSLFPFLAVLICVMGGLIVLLVVLARHGRVQAIRAAQAAASQKKISLEQLHQQQELLRWQAEQIQQSRAKTEAQLAEARLQLSGAEDHLRRLRQELEELQRAWQALEQSARASADPDQLEERLRQMQAEVVRLKHQAAQKIQAVQTPTVSYAIIPYQGPHGTQRRPIYIECRQEAIVLQPEGIVLTPRDFEGPITQETPLARAVRAVREYWANQASALPEAQEPYPLLLVRPDGIVAYYMAREALAEWGSEFGYELIGQDWQLRFPPADPQLAQILDQEVQLARARQEVLAKIAPRVAGRSRPLYRVGPRGIQLEDSGSGGGAGRPRIGRFAQTHPPDKQPFGPRDGPNGAGSSEGTSSARWAEGKGVGPGLVEEGLALQDPAWRRSAQRPEDQTPSSRAWTMEGWAEARTSKQALPAEGAGPGDGSASMHRAGAASHSTGGPGQFGSATPLGGPAGMGQPIDESPSGGFAMAPHMPGTSGSGAPLGTGSFSGAIPSSAPEGGQTAGSFSATRQWIAGLPATGSSPPPQSEADFGPSATGQPFRPGLWYDPSPKPASRSLPEGENLFTAQASRQAKPLASAPQPRSVRGRNWALPAATDNAIPITRPIIVDCYTDRLLIAPGDPLQKEIPLGPKTLDSLDELVGAVWEHIESWGIAGRAMYWRPVLSVRVAPGAEHRFQDLQRLLENSGLLIERRE